jgi:signal transduction histidine kinase
MMQFSRSVSQVRFIYVMTTVFLVGLSIFSFVQINNLFTSSNIIYHTNHVEDALQGISLALMDAESNKRGFQLTGDSMMLVKRDLALKSLEVSQKKLDSLILGNPQQLQHAVLLYSAIDKRVINLRTSTIDHGPMYIPDNLRSNINEGIAEMRNVRALLDAMAQKEAFLLEQRTEMFSRQSLIAPLYIIVLFLGALLILFFSYFRINKELHQSQKLHAVLLQQNQDRAHLGEELLHVNQELAFQNQEKEKRASELAIANEELEYQNVNKEKLAAELIIANHELAFQNEQKEQRASELLVANAELQLFLNISSHDLQEPLRKIQMAASRIDQNDYMALSQKGRDHFIRMQEAAISMQALIDDLLTYSRTNSEERKFENMDIRLIVDEVRNELKDAIEEKGATIEVIDRCEANVIHFQFRQLMSNIISNALKFSKPDQPQRIVISSSLKKGSDCHVDKLIQDQEYCHIRIADNGIGFENIYKEKIFEVFQRLYGKETYKGTGIGLAIVKRIVENHNGVITANGEPNKGSTFDIYIPTLKIPRNG